MPTVIVRIDRKWLPDFSKRLEQSGLTSTHRFTKALLQRLDWMVADVVNKVDGSDLQSGQVVIYPYPNHPWASHASTFCFDVQPGNGRATNDYDKARRRAAIADALGKKLAAFFNEELDDYVAIPEVRFPTFDIEVRPLSSTGHNYHLSDEGSYEPLHSWGRRDREFGD